MPLDGPTAPSCKARFSEPSPHNRLARFFSQIASTPLVQSWPKATLAAFFFGLTNYVIFEDVLRHGAAITTDHLLSFGVLVGTFAAGHWFWPTARQWHIGGAFGLALLFCVGTLYCVITSAGRNAAALTAKASEITAQDGPRASLERQLKDAERDRDKAQAALDAATTEANEAATKAAGECGTGVKNKCGGKTFNSDAAEGRKAKRQKEYDEKTSNYWMLDARLSRMLKKEANGDLKYAAKVLGYLGFTISDDALVDLIPFAKSLFCEFITLVLASGAFGHRRSQPFRETVPPAAETVPQEAKRAIVPKPRNRFTAKVLTFPERVETVASPKDAALKLLRDHLAVHGTTPQDGLKELLHAGSESTVSRWLKEWEAARLIQRATVGRCKRVALAEPARSIRFVETFLDKVERNRR